MYITVSNRFNIYLTTSDRSFILTWKYLSNERSRNQEKYKQLTAEIADLLEKATLNWNTFHSRIIQIRKTEHFETKMSIGQTAAGTKILTHPVCDTEQITDSEISYDLRKNLNLISQCVPAVDST